MRRRFLAAEMILSAVLACSIARAATPPPPGSTLEAAVAKSPCDWQQRATLVSQCQRGGDHAAAYYHAAWLAWLGPGEYVDSALGGGLLLDRASRDRVSLSDNPQVGAIVASVDAERQVYRTCLNGAVAQASGRLVADTTELLARAQSMEALAGRNDAVVRMAVAHAGLALDDALALDTGTGSAKRRSGVLRAAASRTATVAAWYPQAPGPHRLLAVIRARLAELPSGLADSRAELWDAAIAEANLAHELDPGDPFPQELLWTLHLRAGHWSQAADWQAKIEAAARATSEQDPAH